MRTKQKVESRKLKSGQEVTERTERGIATKRHKNAQ